MSMLVYVAGPIDKAPPPGADSDLYEAVSGYWAQAPGVLLDAGVAAVFSPRGAWSVSAGGDPRIQGSNTSVLLGADGVLAYLPDGVLTIGTPIELYIAASKGIPAVAITDGGRSSITLDWLKVAVSHSLIDAAELLVAMIQENQMIPDVSEGAV